MQSCVQSQGGQQTQGCAISTREAQNCPGLRCRGLWNSGVPGYGWDASLAEVGTGWANSHCPPPNACALESQTWNQASQSHNGAPLTLVPPFMDGSGPHGPCLKPRPPQPTR
jgi:hypothetical protein